MPDIRIHMVNRLKREGVLRTPVPVEAHYREADAVAVATSRLNSIAVQANVEVDFEVVEENGKRYVEARRKKK